MPTAFLGCRAAVQAFEVGFDLFSCSRLNRTTRVHQLISRISPRDALKNCRRESLNLPISLREDELQTSKTVYSNSGETVDPIFNGKLPDTPAQLIVDLFISRQEECCMEVTEKATADAREEYGLPNSDDYKIAKKKLPKEMEKRPLARPQTVTSTGRPNVAAITSSPESHNPSAPVDFTDFSGETPLLALFSDILARPGGPTPHESRLLASVYNAAQCVEERNRSTAWEEWLQEPLDGHALYSPGECLDSSFTTGESTKAKLKQREHAQKNRGPGHDEMNTEEEEADDERIMKEADEQDDRRRIKSKKASKKVSPPGDVSREGEAMTSWARQARSLRGFYVVWWQVVQPKVPMHALLLLQRHWERNAPIPLAKKSEAVTQLTS
ncbi:uncharacterized protein LACBIDRAFT_322540 [Laccaria bicolor S238N-H82]|uniref:Predicted protein n=1 Tax=Laccaria bicolor (strain S238N-H82 / ATCC MYA-4686) TaxID=486041 RepID=B0CWN7_LACBS|nr:uncharacterized protein LACBIDRAFT_322540 [Laccaria bicolor S238N-H82]EDR13100.1 predicted protein [Laccaria bicolor S238N-H82]|eukprot:XP_001875598.1 predicted protein [Laccaria bicolor S238N-H82]